MLHSTCEDDSQDQVESQYECDKVLKLKAMVGL